MKAVLGALLFGLSTFGCAAAPSRPSLAAPPMEAAPAAAVAVPANPASTETPRVSAPAPSVGARDQDGASSPSIAALQLTLLDSARELSAANGQCATACRALGSMDRATARLCSIAVSSNDQRACGDAKEKLRAARSSVRASCTACPDGVSVDPDAP